MTVRAPAALPDALWDGEKWWEPCPAPGRRFHRLLEGHGTGRDGRCWVPATPQAFDRWRSGHGLPPRVRYPGLPSQPFTRAWP